LAILNGGWLELEPKRLEFYNKITVNITYALQQQRGFSLVIFSPLKTLRFNTESTIKRKKK